MQIDAASLPYRRAFSMSSLKKKKESRQNHSRLNCLLLLCCFPLDDKYWCLGTCYYCMHVAVAVDAPVFVGEKEATCKQKKRGGGGLRHTHSSPSSHTLASLPCSSEESRGLLRLPRVTGGPLGVTGEQRNGRPCVLVCLLS